MRMRIMTAAIVLAVGIVGIAPAQQTGQRSKDPGNKRAREPQFTRHMISAIRFEGDGPKPGENVRTALLSRVGQPLDLDRLNTDVRTLMRTKWYSSVQVYYEESPRKSGRVVLTFDVHARVLTSTGAVKPRL
jgi:outer membrane protein assembly factor BamA